MKAPASEYVTLVEVLEVTVPLEEFAQAVGAATSRLEAEGGEARRRDQAAAPSVRGAFHRDVRVYGKLSEEAEAWIGQFDVLSKKFERHLAGFVR